MTAATHRQFSLTSALLFRLVRSLFPCIYLVRSGLLLLPLSCSIIVWYAVCVCVCEYFVIIFLFTRFLLFMCFVFTSHLWHIWVVVMLIVIACKTQIKTMSLSFNVDWWCGRFSNTTGWEEWVHVWYLMSRPTTANPTTTTTITITVKTATGNNNNSSQERWKNRDQETADDREQNRNMPQIKPRLVRCLCNWWPFLVSSCSFK